MSEQINLTDDFLPHEFPYLTAELEKRASLELFENEDTRIHSLDQLRTMLKGETFHWMDEDIFLLAYLRVRKFDVQRAFQAIKSFYEARSKHKDLFSCFEYSDINRILSVNVVGFLPFKDKDGCSIMYAKYENWNPPDHDMGQVFRAIAAALFHALLSPSTQVAGVKILTDFQGLTLRNISYVSPKYLQFLGESLQNSLPVRFRGFYIVNENVFVPYLWFILKHFLSKKLRERFHFFGKDFAKLHQHISPKILPKEYGGDIPLIDSLEWARSVAQKSDYLMNILCINQTNH